MSEIKCPKCGAESLEAFQYVEDISCGRGLISCDGGMLTINSEYETDGFDDGENARLLCECGAEFKVPEALEIDWV